MPSSGTYENGPGLSGGLAALLFLPGMLQVGCGIFGIVWASRARKSVQKYNLIIVQRPSRINPRRASTVRFNDAEYAHTRGLDPEYSDDDGYSMASPISRVSRFPKASMEESEYCTPDVGLMSYLLGFLILVTLHGLWELAWKATQLSMNIDPSDERLYSDNFRTVQSFVGAIGYTLTFITWGLFCYIFYNAVAWCTTDALLRNIKFGLIGSVLLFGLLNGLIRFLGASAFVPLSIALALLGLLVSICVHALIHVHHRRPLIPNVHVRGGKTDWEPKGTARLTVVSAFDILALVLMLTTAIMSFSFARSPVNRSDERIVLVAPISIYLLHLGLTVIVLVGIFQQWMDRTIPSMSEVGYTYATPTLPTVESIQRNSSTLRRRSTASHIDPADEMMRRRRSNNSHVDLGDEVMRRRSKVRSISMDPETVQHAYAPDQRSSLASFARAYGYLGPLMNPGSAPRSADAYGAPYRSSYYDSTPSTSSFRDARSSAYSDSVASPPVNFSEYPALLPPKSRAPDRLTEIELPMASPANSSEDPLPATLPRPLPQK